MIVGNGMVARAFKSLGSDQSLIIHAAGVSNSQETNQLEFKRDLDLVTSTLTLHPRKKFIYISSTSILHSSTPYSDHKNSLEQMVMRSRDDYLIVRLPQVAGLSNNQTIIPFFVRSCVLGQSIKIQSEASRNIIDVLDVALIVIDIAKKISSPLAANLLSPKNDTALDILKSIENALQIKAKYELCPGGSSSTIPCSDIFKTSSFYDKIIHPNYSRYVIARYAQMIRNNFFLSNL